MNNFSTHNDTDCNQMLDEIVETTEEPKVVPWGFWATTGFSALIFVLLVILQSIIIGLFVFAAKTGNPGIDIEVYSQHISSDGFCLAISFIISTPICIALTILFAKLRRNFPVKKYLALIKPSSKEIAKWLFITVIFMILSDMFTYFLNRPIVPEFMVNIYKTARFIPLLSIALLVMAPLFEEFFFRGFVLQGYRHSWPGNIGAVFITALIWSVIHLQYDLYGIMTIFVFGIFLGIARLKSGSIYVTIAMHSFMNLVATIEVVIYVNFFQ